jgi:hypothetical protein
MYEFVVRVWTRNNYNAFVRLGLVNAFRNWRDRKGEPALLG